MRTNNMVDRLPTRRSDVREYVLDGEAVLFDPKTSGLHLLNQTALTLWRRCDGRASLGDLARALSGSRDVPLETAHEHARVVVELFQAKGILDTAGDA